MPLHDSSMSASQDVVELLPCPVCTLRLPTADLEVHVAEHFPDESRGQQQQQQDCLDAVLCSQCSMLVPLDQLDSHEEAHTLQNAGSEGATALALAAAEDARLRELQQQEQEQFAALQARYGFSDQRPGRCHLCGQAGHWRSTCPNNPRALCNRPALSTDAAELAAQQTPEDCPAANNIIPLLKQCLEAQAGPGVTAYLSGPVQHLSSRQQADAGWGCGYRNLQMVASHLQQRCPEMGQALFGGCGFVPDIPSLQAWIECAWQAGFDPQGAQQLGGKVQGTHKWIGTSEAAAVLRYFGIRAHIVDFISRSSCITTADGATVHTAVQCDLCGAVPIIGVRHKSTISSDFDVCSSCLPSPAAQQHAPFIPLGQQGHDAGAPHQQEQQHQQGQQHCSQEQQQNPQQPEQKRRRRQQRDGGSADANGSSNHQALIDWVWAYYSARPEAASSSGDGASTSHGMSTSNGVSSGNGAGSSNGSSTSAGCPAAEQRSALSELRSSGVMLTNRPPLYFQHEGHSRTIVGIERRQQQGQPPSYSLLLLDPGCPSRELEAALRSKVGWQRRIKRGVHTLRQPEFQVLHFGDGVAQGADREALKTLTTSERYS